MLAEFVTSKYFYFIEVIAPFSLPPAYISSQVDQSGQSDKAADLLAAGGGKAKKTLLSEINSESSQIIERMQHLLFEMLKRLVKVQ